MEDYSTSNAAGKGKGKGTGNGTGKSGSGGGSGEAQKQNPGLPIPSNPKLCKGCLFYSANRHSKSKDPTCFGINRTYDKLPPHVLRAADIRSSIRGASNKDFIYSCLGYSIYFDDKSSSVNSQNKIPKVPHCIGLEFMMQYIGYRPATTTERKGLEHATPQLQEREGYAPQPRGHEHATPQPQGNSKPAHVPGEQFLKRFRRNMGVVALGVARSLKRVGNSVKETLDNRREPK